MPPPSRSRINKTRALGIVGTAIAVLVTSYYIYQKVTSAKEDNGARPPEGDSVKENKKARKSKCIIMSKSIQGLPIKWEEYAADEVVLLVPTSHTDGSMKQAIEDAFRKTKNEHKIIYCDSMDGLWSCVRRLGKFQCILNSRDFTSSGGSDAAVVPEDIGRFVKFVVDSDIEDVLIDTLCN